MPLAFMKYCLKHYEHQTGRTFLGIYSYIIFERKGKFVILYVNVKYSFWVNFIYFKKTQVLQDVTREFRRSLTPCEATYFQGKRDFVNQFLPVQGLLSP